MLPAVRADVRCCDSHGVGTHSQYVAELDSSPVYLISTHDSSHRAKILDSGLSSSGICDVNLPSVLPIYL